MAPLIVLPIGAIMILLASLHIERKGFFAGCALFLLAAAFVLNYVLQPAFEFRSTLFVFDGLSQFFNAVFILVGFLVGLFVLDRHKNREVVFYSMLLAGTAAMVIIASSRNIIGIFLGLELLSLCFYELCALKKDGIGLESAGKLFFMSIFASALFIFGAVLVYRELHTFDLQQFLRFHTSPAFITGLGLILAGLFFKMSLFPFNLWLPDVYQGAPSEVTALLASSAKKAGFAAFLRLIPVLTIFNGSAVATPYMPFGFQGIMAGMSFLTMSFANVVAIVQKNVKRMIAYSIVAHAGFLAIGLAAATKLGYLGLLFHILVHACMATGVFLILAILEDHRIKDLDEYNGLSRRAPLVSILLTTFLLSLTGIPPFAGFLSKFLLWSSAMEAGYTWLAAAAIINSALSTYFYFLILWRIWGFAPHTEERLPDLLWNQQYALLVPAALIIILGLYPGPVLSYIQNAIATSIYF